MPESSPKMDDRICHPGQDVLILFARTPVPGRVKSRLLSRLTPEQACRLHVAATLDTAELLDNLTAGEVPLVRWVFWSEPPAPDALRIALPASFRSALQRGADLGERMADAFCRAFACGARGVAILGSDSPHLPTPRIHQAFDRLGDHDGVLGPAADGGFYLIGSRRFDARLFQGVEWGGPEVLKQTLANAARIHYRFALLEPWYDLDEWSDVERLLTEVRGGLRLPPRVAEFMNNLKNEKRNPA